MVEEKADLEAWCQEAAYGRGCILEGVEQTELLMWVSYCSAMLNVSLSAEVAKWLSLLPMVA